VLFFVLLLGAPERILRTVGVVLGRTHSVDGRRELLEQSSGLARESVLAGSRIRCVRDSLRHGVGKGV